MAEESGDLCRLFFDAFQQALALNLPPRRHGLSLEWPPRAPVGPFRPLILSISSCGTCSACRLHSTIEGRRCHRTAISLRMDGAHSKYDDESSSSHSGAH